MNACINKNHTPESTPNNTKQKLQTHRYFINCSRKEGISLEEYNTVYEAFPNANILMDAESLYVWLLHETRENFCHFLEIVRLPQEKTNPLQITYSMKKKYPKLYQLFDK